MTTIENLQTPEIRPLSADEVYETVAAGMRDIDTRGVECEMSVVPTALTEVPINGRHHLLVLDETLQPGNNFKYHGASYAVWRAKVENPNLQAVVTGTAGNFGSALAASAQKLGLRCYITAPKDLVAAKRTLMEAYGSTIDAHYNDVSEAIAAAEGLVDGLNDTEFIHPFNNLHAIAGQAMIGQRLVKGLLRQQTAGRLDLRHDPIRLLVQRGGGSLLTGVACAVRQLKDTGLAGDNVQVHEVRPELAADGRLNLKYDGLAVAEAGSYAQAVLADTRFIQGSRQISELDTGHAALQMHWRLHKSYEPSGLAGVAACLQAMETDKTPTTYVAVLSGANVTPERFRYFANEITAADQARRLGNLSVSHNIVVPANQEPTKRTTKIASGHNFPRAALLPNARLRSPG